MLNHIIRLCLICWIGFTAFQPAPSTTVITPENAKTVAQTAVLGRGEINNMFWSADGKTLGVSTRLGAWHYTIIPSALMTIVANHISPQRRV